MAAVPFTLWRARAGGADNDLLTGGFGADTFIFAASFGIDTISDFTTTSVAHGFIRIDHTLLADFVTVQASATQVGSDVEITVDAGNKIILSNLLVSALTASDFIFV